MHRRKKRTTQSRTNEKKNKRSKNIQCARTRDLYLKKLFNCENILDFGFVWSAKYATVCMVHCIVVVACNVYAFVSEYIGWPNERVEETKKKKSTAALSHLNLVWMQLFGWEKERERDRQKCVQQININVHSKEIWQHIFYLTTWNMAIAHSIRPIAKDKHRHKR